MRLAIHVRPFVIRRAFTLAEVLIALALSILTVTGIIYGYLCAAKRAEWNGYSFAAQSMAQQGIEMARSAQWDPTATPPIDLCITNAPNGFTSRWDVLDIPVVSNRPSIYATNFWTISTVTVSPPVKCIKVDCVWSWLGQRNFTNTVITYRAP